MRSFRSPFDPTQVLLHFNWQESGTMRLSVHFAPKQNDALQAYQCFHLFRPPGLALLQRPPLACLEISGLVTFFAVCNLANARLTQIEHWKTSQLPAPLPEPTPRCPRIGRHCTLAAPSQRNRDLFVLLRMLQGKVLQLHCINKHNMCIDCQGQSSANLEHIAEDGWSTPAACARLAARA